MNIEYNATQTIKAMVREYVNEPERDLWLERRDDPPNPFYGQTESGLFLELYYGMPARLWTPWGKYDLGGSSSGHWGAVVAELLVRLGASLHEPMKVNFMGEFGPIYALSKVDEVELSPAKLRPRAEFVEYHESERAWEKQVESNRS